MKSIACVVVLIFFSAVAVPSSSQEALEIRGKSQQLQLYGKKSGTPIILSSGDLGWSGLVVHVAESLASQGYYVIGFNSKSYLSGFTGKERGLSPREVPDDYAILIEYASRGMAAKPILAGISEGAGLSVLAATKESVKARVRGILGLGLPDQSELGWKWQDFTIWITKKSPKEPSFMVEDIIGAASPLPLAEIHSTHDEFLPLEKAKAMFAHAGNPKKMWIVEASNHRFSDNRSELDHCILEALRWIIGFAENPN
jgi:hypothetical protein